MLKDKRSRRRIKVVEGTDVATFTVPASLIKRRLLDAVSLIEASADDITYQHSILCQTSLPYRDPGAAVRRWTRTQGRAALEIEAGRAMHPELDTFVDVPLPYGPKARLILMHLNAEALRTGSSKIDVGDSLTAFVKRINLAPKGQNIRLIREQVTALSAATIRLGFSDGLKAKTVQSQIVAGFELWLPKDDRQRVLWPSYVELSGTYFESLQNHAVPLDENAIGGLSHSAMALDIYAWLAQRLYRIPKPGSQLVPWTAVREQFGFGYQSIRKFRQVFMEALRQVHAVYPAARIDVTGEGLCLFTSPAPISPSATVKRLR